MLDFVDIFSVIATFFGGHRVDLNKLISKVYKGNIDNCSVIFEIENLNDISVNGTRHVEVIWHDDNECEHQSNFELNEDFVVHSFEKAFITLLTDRIVFSSIKNKGALFLFEIEDVGKLEVYCDSLLAL